MVKRFEVYMGVFQGVEKPCLIVSPDELNEVLPYALVAPITVSSSQLPTRVGIGLRGKKAYIAMDLIQPVNQKDLKLKIGLLPDQIHRQIVEIIQKIFAY